MKKKILIGSLLVLTLLLLMPSIPAIQQKTIEEGIKQEMEEKLESITFDDLKDIDTLDGIKHPLLRAFVVLLHNIQGLRFCFYFVLAFVVFAEPSDDGDIPGNPILFFLCLIRAALLLGVGMFWAEFWNYISESFGWNWNFNPW